MTQYSAAASICAGVSHRRIIVLGVSVLVLVVLTFAVTHRPLLIWNATASAPIGLYEVVPEANFARGDLVLIRPPQWVRTLAAARGYLPETVPMVKRIAAQNGDTVCRQADTIMINQHVLAHALVADREGRLLPAWSGCQRLRDGDVFLLMDNVRASFDSRYFGPVPTSGIIGKLVPLWTR